MWVNLFIPSEEKRAEKGIRIRQQTKFPDEPSTALLLTAEKPTACEIRLRVPAWATTGYKVRVNGKPEEKEARSGSYVSIQRTWKTGDRIDIDLPMQLRAEPTPDDPSVQAFAYGPLMLAGDLGNEGLTPESYRGTPDEKVKNHFLRGQPVAVPAISLESSLSKSIERENAQALRFRLKTPGTPPLVPFNRIQKQRYAVYWKTSRNA